MNESVGFREVAAWKTLALYKESRSTVREAASYLREVKGYSEIDVAIEAGVTKTTVRYWVRKHTEATEDET